MKIVLRKILEKGCIVDIKLVEGKVEILHEGELIEIIPQVAFNNLFARRNSFKGKILEDGKMLVIRHIDVHRHSGYSLLDGMNKIEALAERTEWAGGILDHGVMYGVRKFYEQMVRAKKKPIIGFEAYTESIDGEKKRYHMPLIAKNSVGYQNLTKLTSLGWTNVYKKPHLKYEWLREYSEGVIATSGCIGGEIPKLLIKNEYKKAKEVACELISIFGKENFFIEVQRHDIDIEEQLNIDLVKLAKEVGVKVIATTDSHYTDKNDAFVHEILLCIQTKTTINDGKRFKFPGRNYHLHSSEEMENLWRDMPEVLDNTLDLADMIDFEMKYDEIYMPEFPLPEGYSSEKEYFEHLCFDGYDKRFKGTEMYDNEEYRERIQFEIDTINRMGFPGYFIIVWDFVNYAKSKGILVGPGRGSACGSLVAYCLFITEIDPIRYGLLFERFLNVDRVSMPDIDLDFQDDRREEVIEYVESKYGAESVSRIITFGTMAARMVVRDITRVTEKPYALGDRIAKAIPNVPKMTLKKALETSQEFSSMYSSEESVKNIVDIAMRLEGLPRNMSQHACGVIIAPKPVNNFIPQVMAVDRQTNIAKLTTQFPMNECEDILLKMDFLGLRTMGVIGNALIDINKKRKDSGLEEISYTSIPLNDVKVYDFISKGNTEGVFQLEGPGMTSFMTQLFQDVHGFLNVLSEKELAKKGEELFERAIAGISLYRPGPIDEIPNYLKFMLNPEEISYEVPELKPILDNTYSVIVYQEQCMFIVRVLAGFSKGQADMIRKAMAKKKDKILDEYEEYFIYGSENKDKDNSDDSLNIKGCLNNGISEEIAKNIWEKMRKFGEYAFNKSHAGGYADIGVRTAWLSYYYPSEYMCATLNSYLGKADKIRIYMAVCKKKNIELLPPDVNESKEKFAMVGEAIRFGLMGIKDMGSTSSLVIKERNERGKFKSFQDFAERMATYQEVDKSVLEALVYSGAVDNFEGTRSAKISMLAKLINAGKNEKKNFNTGQLTMFDIAMQAGNEDILSFKELPIPDIKEFEKRYKLEKEKEYAGFYVTEHPLDDYAKYFSEGDITETRIYLNNNSEEDDTQSIESEVDFDGQSVKIAGIVKDVKLFYTKRSNEAMNVFTIEDRTGEIKCVAFPKQREKNVDKIKEGKIVIINGEIKSDDRGLQLIVSTMIDVDALKMQEIPDAIWLKGASSRMIARGQWTQVRQITSKSPGDVTIFFCFGNEKHQMQEKINLSLNTMLSLQELLGERNVKVMYKK